MFENLEKYELKCFFLQISDYPDTDAREENNDFLVEYSSKSVVISIENLMGEIGPVAAEK